MEGLRSHGRACTHGLFAACGNTADAAPAAPAARRGMPAHFKYSHVCVCVLPLAHALLSFNVALRPSAPFSVAHSSPLSHSRLALSQTLCTACIPFPQVAIDGRGLFFVMEDFQFNLYSPCIDYIPQPARRPVLSSLAPSPRAGAHPAASIM